MSILEFLSQSNKLLFSSEKMFGALNLLFMFSSIILNQITFWYEFLVKNRKNLDTADSKKLRHTQILYI